MKSFVGAAKGRSWTRFTFVTLACSLLVGSAMAQNRLTYFITFGSQNTDTDGVEQSNMINPPITPANAWLYRHNDLMVRQDLTNRSTRGNAGGTFANRTKSMNYSLWVRNDFANPITFTSGNVMLGISNSTAAGSGASRTDFRLQVNGNVGNSATTSRTHWAAGAGLDPAVTSWLGGGANPAGQPTNATRPWGLNLPIVVAGGGSITLQPGQVYRMTDFSIWNQSATTQTGGSADMVVYDAGQGTTSTTFLTNGSTVWRPSGVGTTNTPTIACKSIMVDALPFPPQIQVGLGCFEGNPAIVPMTFEFRRQNTMETLFTYTTNPTGFNNLYVLDVPFANEFWNIGCVGKTFLRSVRHNVRLNVFGQITNFFLANGDADGDNAITASDYGIWAAANNSLPGDWNWDDRADFDWDGAITAADYGAWQFCFGQVGDE